MADRYPDTYSIVVTGPAVAELEDQLRRAGAFSVLAKPFVGERFVAAVQEAMDHRDERIAVRRHQSA